MKRTRKQWTPMPGSYASYIGRSSRLLRGGKILEVVAEATGAPHGCQGHWARWPSSAVHRAGEESWSASTAIV